MTFRSKFKFYSKCAIYDENTAKKKDYRIWCILDSLRHFYVIPLRKKNDRG